MQTTNHRRQREIFDEKAGWLQNTLNSRFPAGLASVAGPTRHPANRALAPCD
jgi:hypothetical protein